VGTRKVRDLLAGKAHVRVVSPTLTTELSEIVDTRDDVSWRRGNFEPSDLDGAFLVVTTTNDLAVNQSVADEAQRRRLLFNSADDPDRCNFYLTALVRRDPVLVSISTSGASPALASYLRRRLDAYLENELGELAMVLSSVREQLHDEGVATEFLPWSSVVNDDLLALVAKGETDRAREDVLRVVRPS